MVLKKMINSPSSRALIVKINLVFLACVFISYAVLLLWPWLSEYHQRATSIITCSLLECHKAENSIKMKAVLEEAAGGTNQSEPVIITREEARAQQVPSFLKDNVVIGRSGKGLKIGMVNMEDEDTSEWKAYGINIIPILFDKVSVYFEWKDLFPEWIDEEEERDGPLCPMVPMPDFDMYTYMDVIVAKLPCKFPEQGWNRDVFRLQVHLIVANLAVKRGKRDYWHDDDDHHKKRRSPTTKVVFLSECTPMVELFRCDDFVRREGNWWYYRPDMTKLEHKVSLPVGSCDLALPLWEKGVDKIYDVSKLWGSSSGKREAYATILHSSESYVCGAIILAQSLLRSGTKRDLILLLDNSISEPKRAALARAGWKIRFIKRIRNTKAEKYSYNEYNYSKFRLWQLTDYDKIIFVDSDIIVLRNLDILFNFPQMSATGNDGSIFNSGIMVIEPSNCTFHKLMRRRKDIVSYNGGDQGFLNEIFVWWHRLPRRVNFLKNFWSNSSIEASVKNQLFSSDPPKLYSIHYLGLKPWLCYRDYDCNWDIQDQRVYASDAAHLRWWKLHDAMDQNLQEFCALSKRRKIELEWDRKNARKMRSRDQHWRINVTDPRRHI